MLNQKKVEIFSRKICKSLAKQFLEVALAKMAKKYENWFRQSQPTILSLRY